MNRAFQEEYSDVMEKLMSTYTDGGVSFKREMYTGTGRVDLGTSDYRYGVEIKSSLADLKSGYGLNQENFAFGYVLCPEEILNHAIGYLYMNGYENSGVIVVWKNGKISLAKPARCNLSARAGLSVFHIIAGSTDEIANCFYDHDGVVERKRKR